MKKLHYFFTVILLMFSVAATAQKYHDAEIDELKGHVKKCIWSFGGGSETYTFTEEGKFDVAPGCSNFVYNSNGYAISCDLEYMGQKGKETFSYNAKKQVVKQVMTFPEGTITHEVTYNSDGTVKTQVETVSVEGMSQSVTINYTYEAFDKQGNWTRRIATVGNQSEVQTRAITYW